MKNTIGRVILTWDGGPNVDVPLKILKLAQVHSTDAIELYWSSAQMLRQDLVQDLRLGSDDPTEPERGSLAFWFRQLADRRDCFDWCGFTRQLLDPTVLELCRMMSRHPDVSLSLS